MEIAGFGVESWLNEHERNCQVDISQSTISSLTFDDLLQFESDKGEAFLAALRQEKLNYGWIEGSPEFKQGVASLYDSVSTDHILQTNGTTGANFAALYALVNPEDEIIAQYPAYQQNYDIPLSFGCKVVHWNIAEDNNWLPKLEDLPALVTDKTKLIAVTNAHNPTGALMDRAYLEALVDFARAHDLYVLVDEVYRPVDPEIDFVSIVDLYEKGIATSSLSKSFSLPGIRIGWVAVRSDELADALRVYRDYTMICGGVLNDACAVLAFKHKDKILARNQAILNKNLEYLQQWVDSEPHASIIAPRMVSTSCVRLNLPCSDEDFALRLLRDYGTLVVPGMRFDIPGCVRVGYATKLETLETGLKNLSACLRDTWNDQA